MKKSLTVASQSNMTSPRCIHHFSNGDSFCLSNAYSQIDGSASALADAQHSSNKLPCNVSIGQACSDQSRHKLDSVLPSEIKPW